ncbi:curved DNA-binding protein CbpA [Pseudochelatococcus contaminans]|uniref:Curved DNA-binding protein CbpA n=2 Tax=Pseudochelatococcus contaminans TaxID=1538103 RepID=A0A7W5Z1L4_9HYPH|nr:J domain-containing protein [Pseudochelatococcus contaminans]MBB3808187.1 curved DNA-binding protein CbpA [Pseudochelatococcus contaminans]
MNINSRLFDRIRTRPKRAEEASSPSATTCEHPGCAEPGRFRAPKGRGQEGQYWNFCLEHVRAYNQSYNYFNGMSDNDVAAYQKDATTGHRPTWSMGVNNPTTREAMRARREGMPGGEAYEIDDSFGLFTSRTRQSRTMNDDDARPRLSSTAIRALDQLGLDAGVDALTIKARYKLLVKRFHPDANGGDRSFEERLQEIISAYNTLKAIGLV